MNKKYFAFSILGLTGVIILALLFFSLYQISVLKNHLAVIEKNSDNIVSKLQVHQERIHDISQNNEDKELTKQNVIESGTVQFESHGIEISVPSGWAGTGTDGIDRLFVIKNPEAQQERNPYGAVGDVTITARFVSSDEPLQKWFSETKEFTSERIQERIEYMARESTLNPPLSTDDILVQIEQVEVDGKSAISQYKQASRPIYIEGGPFTSKSIYFKHNGYIYEIEMRTPTGPGIDTINQQFDDFVKNIRVIQLH